MTKMIHIDNRGLQHPPVQPQFEAVLSPDTGLMWSIATIGGKKMTHADAEKAVKELCLCGFSDWRLPTIKELLTLVDYERHSPAIDTDFFPDTKSDWYWTASSSAFYSGYAWIVYFGSGGSSTVDRSYDAFVRAVRSARQ